ncbi:MAG: GNAT family N-acetyltransferase [Candidatus Bathyarchaeia archaeon]
MQYKTVTLKNGQTASLGWLEQADLAEVIEALNSVIREQKSLLILNEINDLEFEHQWFAEEIDLGMRYLVARVGGKVVGGASLTPLSGKRSHIAEYGIYVIDSHRDLGLGTLLTKAFVEIARKSRFEIIQLSVFSNNKRAMHIYGKCGFKKCGKLKNDVKFADGTYADRILMEQALPR